MNPLEVAWYVLKASEEPARYLNDILGNTDVWQLEHEHEQADSSFQPGDYISQLIGNVINSVAQGHSEHPHIVDSVLNTRIFEPDYEHGPDDEAHITPDMREEMKTSFHDFIQHSPLNRYHSSQYNVAPSNNQWDDDEDEYCSECGDPLDGDDDCDNPRCENYYDRDYDSTDASERGDNAYSDIPRSVTSTPRSVTSRGRRRMRASLPWQQNVPTQIEGLPTPLTAASQGEGRVGPDVMDERELMRYEAPQLEAMIEGIHQELARRG